MEGGGPPPVLQRDKKSPVLIGLIFGIVLALAAGLNSTNLENLVNCLYPSLPRYAPFHDSHQKTLAFRHRD